MCERHILLALSMVRKGETPYQIFVITKITASTVKKEGNAQREFVPIWIVGWRQRRK